MSSAIQAQMDAGAERVVDLMIRARAERYRRRPCLLDNLSPGLSTCRPAAMLARIDALIEQERRTPRRHIGFGGENTEISLRAARLYAVREAETMQIEKVA